MRPRKIFLHFLCDPVNSGTFYVDAGGVHTTNVPTPLKKSPGGWLETELKFSRSAKYYGLNRTFGIPLTFIEDGAHIIRSLSYKKRGIEQLIMLVILKWNPDNDVYELYYKGLIDTGKMINKVAEGVQVNVMEGGVVQLLKAYESTVFEIPCDGSIPENVKVKLDGVLFDDVFHYQFQEADSNGAAANTVPMTFVGNDGDNIGVIRNDPIQEDMTEVSNPSTYTKTSSNYVFSDIAAVTVRMQGHITVQPTGSVPANFALITRTSAASGAGPHSISLVPGTANSTDQIAVHQTTTYYFDRTLDLAANETLFPFFFAQDSSHNVKIIGGEFDISFSSKYKTSYPWGIRAYDLFKLIIKNINEFASTSIQHFNYGADSQLLQQYLNFVFNSGDALRASTDTSYQKFFNQANNGSTQGQPINFYKSFGPVIKISLAEFFDTINPILNAALSNQQLTGESESVFLEEKKYVFDPSVITFALDEVQGLQISWALDYFFNILKIGYAPQNYDEKAGKYEYNTTAQWQAPIKTLAKTLELISKARTDSYGIEYTRYNTAGGKSSTYNSSDNSVFLINTETESEVFDTFLAEMAQNLALLTNRNEQGIAQANLTGTYCSPFSNPCLFIFNQPIVAVSYSPLLTLTGFFNGQPGDVLTVNIRVNGIVVATRTYTIIAGQLNINTGAGNNTLTFTQGFNEGDVIWATMQTTATGTAQFSNASLVIPLYFSAVNGGLINIVAGSFEQPVTLINVTDLRPGGGPYLPLTSGFSFLMFNEQLTRQNFDGTLTMGGQIQGSAGNSLTIKLFINGVATGYNFPATTVTSNFFQQVNFNRDYQLGDIIFLTASTTSGCNVTLQTCTLFLQSTQIKVYDLKRKVYDAISGIPNPASAFNIEDLTPKRMLLRNGSLLKSTLFNLIPDQLKFLTLDKNQYLSTTVDGQTITENASINIADLDAPLFYPLLFEFKTKVPLTFAQLMSYSANGHISFKYNGITLYGFPIEITQRPALEESQSWKLLCSPLVNLNDLVDLDIDGLNLLNLMANDSFISHLCPVKFVPLNLAQDSKYHFVHMDQDWFINQVKFWIHKSNFYQPWQLNDTIPLQVITGGIGPAQVDIYNCDAKSIYSTNMSVVTTDALQGSNLLYEFIVNPTSLGLTEGVYYFVYTIGSKQYISEGQWLKSDWPMTLLINYRHSVNKQSMIFSSGYNPSIRVPGWIDQFNPEAKFATYEDQPADLEMLNGIPFRTHKLNITATGVSGAGVPDWVIDKVNRIMLLNTTVIDGMAYSRDSDAKWEVKNTEAWPKRYWSLAIRPAQNRDGITQTSDGLDENVAVIYNIDGNAFGTDTGENIIQITEED